MKAAVFNRYGGNEVVEVKDVPKPQCGPDEVMIKVRAAGINPVDWKVRYGHARILTGSRFPKILGSECSGEVAEVGAAVKKFKQGDPVIGWPGIRKLGAFAEYVCCREGAVFKTAKGISFEQAACIPIAGLTALQALREKGGISHTKRVLINGASGGVGHFAVQIAKIFGAEVTVVCSSSNAGFVKNLGADYVIDYAQEDFTKKDKLYDIIFDAVAKSSFRRAKIVLTARGIYISTLPSPGVILNQYMTGFFTQKKAVTMWVKPNEEDLQWMMNQVNGGKLEVLIDRVYALDQVKEALAASESGKVRGKLVLTLNL